MRIKISALKDRFGFIVLNEDKVVLDSSKDYILFPSIAPSYKFAWNAYSDANKFSKQSTLLEVFSQVAEDLTQPIFVDIAVEDKIYRTYSGFYKKIEQKLRSTRSNKAEHKKVLQEIELIVGELQKITSMLKDRALSNLFIKFKSLLPKKKKPVPVEASVTIDDDVKVELFEEYGKKACEAIQERHRDCTYRLDVNHNRIGIVDQKGNIIVILFVCDNMNVCNIVPGKEIQKVYPYHHCNFYQLYWKPIVENVGHYFFEDYNSLILASPLSLPEVDQSKKQTVDGWNIKDKKDTRIRFCFSGNKDIWTIEPVELGSIASSQHTEDEYLQHKIVRCIDEKLKSLFQRTGYVQQVISRRDIVEIDVDFGEGLGIVRLSEPQLEFVL